MLPTLQILQQAQTTSILKEEVTKKVERLLLYENQVQEHLGWKFAIEMERAWDELHGVQLDDAYTAGFLAAWKLWAEVSSITTV